MSKLSTGKQYHAGSLRELISLSLPLMISQLSIGVMVFVDRLVLSHLSLEVANASASVMIGVLTLGFFFLTMGNVTEILIGKANGAKSPERMGHIFWQGMWFTLTSAILICVIGLIAKPVMIPAAFQSPVVELYYYHSLIMAVTLVLTTVLTGFFIGQGHARLVTWGNVIANGINLALDVGLVFGLGPLPELGMPGAALATTLSQLLLASILIVGIIVKSKKVAFHFEKWQPNRSILVKFVSIGGPTAVGHGFEMLAWTALIRLMSTLGPYHITIMVLGQTILILLASITEALKQAVTVIASNLIGANKVDKLPRLIFSTWQLIAIVGCLCAIPLLGMSGFIMGIFTKLDSNLDQVLLQQYAIVVCFWVWLYLVLDTTTWAHAGILMAVEDTKFIMWTNGLNAWLFGICPAWLIIQYTSVHPAFGWQVISIYGAVNVACFGCRAWHQTKKQRLQAEFAH